MSTLAFQDAFAGASTGSIAGRVSTSGHHWSLTTASNQNGAVDIDSIPSISTPNTAAGTAVVSDWTPPSSTYGFLAIVESLGGQYQFGPAVRLGVSSSTGLQGYIFNIDTYGSIYNLFRGDTSGATFNSVHSVAHTFGNPETHACYIVAAPDGSGGVNVSVYIDKTLLFTYDDTSGAVTSAGQIGVRGFSNYPSVADGLHVLYCQTDAQAATLTGPTTGAENAQSTAFTLTLEVPAILDCTVTWSDGGVGGTFSPSATSTISGATGGTVGGTTATVRWTPPNNYTGTAQISATTSTPTTTVSGSPINYAVSPTPTASPATLNPSGAIQGPWYFVTEQAATGTTQGGAIRIVHRLATIEFTTVASGAGAMLPDGPTYPARLEVINGGGAALLIYPPPGGTVDGGGADAPYSLSANSVAIFWLTASSDKKTWKVIA